MSFEGKGAGKGWGGNMNPMQVMMQMMKQGGGGGWGSSQDTLSRIHKMDDEVKVYVEGLPDGARWKELQKHCESVGHKPMLCEVTKGGKGVLAFKEAAQATEAIAALDQSSMDGNTITADVWTKKEKSGDKPETNRSSGKKEAWHFQWDCKIYVSGIPAGADGAALEKHFADAGHKPELAEIMGTGKGVAAFSDAAAAKEALTAMNQTSMDGSTISTDEWTKSNKPGGWQNRGNGKGGGGMGGMNPMQAMMMAMMMGKGNSGGNGGNWAGNGGCGGGGAGATQDLGCTCVVSGIPDGITIEEFKENLKQAGQVKTAKFVGPGKAFVAFTKVSEANQCVAMFNGCEIGTSRLQVHIGKQ